MAGRSLDEQQDWHEMPFLKIEGGKVVDGWAPPEITGMSSENISSAQCMLGAEPPRGTTPKWARTPARAGNRAGLDRNRTRLWMGCGRVVHFLSHYPQDSALGMNFAVAIRIRGVDHRVRALVFRNRQRADRGAWRSTGSVGR